MLWSFAVPLAVHFPDYPSAHLSLLWGMCPVLSLFCRSMLMLGKSEDAEPNVLCCGAARVQCPPPARLLLLSTARRADCLRLDPTRQQAGLLSNTCLCRMFRVCACVREGLSRCVYCGANTCSNPCVTDQSEVKHGPNSLHGLHSTPPPTSWQAPRYQKIYGMAATVRSVTVRKHGPVPPSRKP